MRNLSPGGYIELLDPIYPMGCDDDTFPKTSAGYLWTKLMSDAGAKIGRPLDAVLRYKGQLEEVGFVDVMEKVYKWPMNTWPKDARYKEIGENEDVPLG